MKATAPLQKLTGTTATWTTTGKATHNPLQLKTAPGPKRQNPMQVATGNQNPLQLKKENKTGLPDELKAGVEALSGYSMDDVKVHYNSNKPAQLQALAYAQGTDIHVAPGQEQHLPHEVWHVVQQKQGRVKTTLQMKSGVLVNDNKGLEKEADAMGVRSLESFNNSFPILLDNTIKDRIIQRKLDVKYGNPINLKYDDPDYPGYKHSELVGSSAEATFEAGDVFIGSQPGRSSEFSAYRYFNLIQGHLFNDNLGGPAINSNLFPITKKMNGNHSRFAEETVKGMFASIQNPNEMFSYSVIVDTSNCNTNDYSETEAEKVVFHVELKVSTLVFKWTVKHSGVEFPGGINKKAISAINEHESFISKIQNTGKFIHDSGLVKSLAPMTHPNQYLVDDMYSNSTILPTNFKTSHSATTHENIFVSSSYLNASDKKELQTNSRTQVEKFIKAIPTDALEKKIDDFNSIHGLNPYTISAIIDLDLTNKKPTSKRKGNVVTKDFIEVNWGYDSDKEKTRAFKKIKKDIPENLMETEDRPSKKNPGKRRPLKSKFFTNTIPK